MKRVQGRDDVIQIIQTARSTGEIPDLSRAVLNAADLSGLDLSGVNFTRAQLTNARLNNAILVGATLVKADLTFADLQGANFSGADLSNADLRETNHTEAVFKGAKIDKTLGISREQANFLALSITGGRTKNSIRTYEANLRTEANIYSTRTSDSPYLPPVLPYRWEALKREADKRRVPLKPLIKPVPEAIHRIQRELQRIRDTGMGRLYVVSGVTGAGKTTFLNSLDLFLDETIDIKNISLKTIENSEVVESALEGLKRSLDHFSIVILEGRENPGKLKNDELDILLATLNTDFRTDIGSKTLFVIPTTAPTIGERIGERAATIGGMTSPSSLHYIFAGPDKNEYYAITDGTFRALNESRTLNDYGVTDDTANGIAQSSKSIGSFIEGCYEEIIAQRDRLQTLTSSVKRKRLHLWMVFCSYEDDARINYNTIRSLTVGDFQHVQVKRLLIGDSKQVRFWENRQETFAQAALYLDLRLMYLPLRTVTAILTAYGHEEIVKHLKDLDLVDREATRARAQESLEGTALGAFLAGKEFTDPDLTRRRLTEQQQQVFQEAAKFFSKDEKTFNALVAETLRDHYGKPDQQIVTELALTETGSLIADIGIVTPSDVFCLELKWRSTPLVDSEIIRQTAGRVQEFVQELPELRNLLNQRLPLT